MKRRKSTKKKTYTAPRKSQGEAARRKSRILLAVVILGALLLSIALFIVNYVQSRERLREIGAILADTQSHLAL
jgi:hypothetical protein